MTIIFYLICVACVIAEYKVYSNRLEQERYQRFKLNENLENALMDITILEDQLYKLKNEAKKK
jgi:hypothetical protein